MFTRRTVSAGAVAVLAAAAVLPLGAPGRVAAYALMMLVPGAAIYRLVERRPSALEAAAAAFVLSPVVVVVPAALMMLAGVSAQWSARAVIVATAVLAMAALAVPRRPAGDGDDRVLLTGRQWAVLGGCVVLTLFMVGVFPLTSEWWRVRSDAWFHRAVIAQISHGGLPPDDPYFAGIPLQYMWWYHVLVLAVSRVTSLDPFWVMPLVNLQSLTGVFLATALFAGVFVKRFGYWMASCLTVAFSLNGLFWLLLPLKAIRAVLGDVRGTEELARTFSLSPFDWYRVKAFVQIYYNSDFLLEKFVVATAFGLAFALMALFWWAVADYLRRRRAFPLVATGASVVGMLGFHTLFGGVMLVSAGGGLVLSLVWRRRVDGYRLRPSLELAGAMTAAVLLCAPYNYSIMHLKAASNAFPFELSIKKIAAITITSTAAIVLAAFQKPFFTGRDVPRRFVQFALLTMIVFSTVLALPDANNYDKLPYFAYYPLAVVGGWTIADLVSRRRSAAGRVGAAVALAMLVMVPINAICFASFVNTPERETYSPEEPALAAWVRSNTTRDAVFIDRDFELFLLVAGPRRYLCGWLEYARMWQYDKVVMARRLHTRDVLLDGGPLDLTSARLLSLAPWELYVIDRGGVDSGSTVSRHQELFERVHQTESIALYRVDTEACARAARRLAEEGQTEVSPARLVRESGL